MHLIVCEVCLKKPRNRGLVEHENAGVFRRNTASVLSMSVTYFWNTSTNSTGLLDGLSDGSRPTVTNKESQGLGTQIKPPHTWKSSVFLWHWKRQVTRRHHKPLESLHHCLSATSTNHIREFTLEPLSQNKPVLGNWFANEWPNLVRPFLASISVTWMGQDRGISGATQIAVPDFYIKLLQPTWATTWKIVLGVSGCLWSWVWWWFVPLI